MKRYSLGIDIGGTFTDAVLFDREQGRRVAAKTLTTPGHPAVAVVKAVDQIMNRERFRRWLCLLPPPPQPVTSS